MSTVAKIVDYNLNYISKFSLEGINLIFDSGNSLKVNYIDIGIDTHKLCKGLLKEKLMGIINEIYKEHIKLEMLGSGYPVYKIQYLGEMLWGNEKIECSIVNFKTEHGPLKTYKVKKIVDNIWIPINFDCRVNEIIVTHPLNIYNLGGNKEIKVTGLENTMVINDAILDILSYNARFNNHELTFKHLRRIGVQYKKVSEKCEIRKVTLEDTCIVKNIPIYLFENIKTLQEVTICKSVETIADCSPEKYIKQYKGMYYILLGPEQGYRMVEIKFNKGKEPKWITKIVEEPTETT